MLGRTNAQIMSGGEQPFVPPDDSTYILLTTYADPAGAMRVQFYVNKSDTSTLSIDWGDGNTETVTASGTTTVTHDYTTFGNMVVKLWISSGTGTYKLGNSDVLAGSDSYIRQITQIFVGKDNFAGVISSRNFAYCTGLNKCVIPSTVTTMGYNAFYDLKQPIEIVVKATTPPTLSSSGLFNGAQNPITRILVPAASVDAYKVATNWSYFASYIGAIE